MKKLRIALAQINVTVGGLEENRRKIAEFIAKARRARADIVLFPELAVTGYPPEDLLLKPSFVSDQLKAFQRLVSLSRGITAVVGYADRDASGVLYNAAGVLSRGRLAATYRKMALPNYGVFDEKRYFSPGTVPQLMEVRSTRLGLSICEDIWVEGGSCAPAAAQAKVLLNISASPYQAGKRRLREALLSRRARQYKAWVIYVNLVGGQDELVFDGGSLVVNPAGRIIFRAPQFQEGLFLVDLPAGPRRPVSVPLGQDEEIFQALVLGLRDYVRKNRFSHVVVGLSGGIDSNLTAAIAVAALGRESVTGVSMPSRYSSVGTRADARLAAKRLGIQFLEIPIEPMFQAALGSLKKAIGQTSVNLTEENLQARIRGTLLMALSNRFGWLVLSTGNKSEISTGYCTLYGDMVGGFAVIKDIPKTRVYRLVRVANRHFKKKVVPDSVIRRPPTAELKPNQRDQDTLPPYGRLDAIIRAYVEERRPALQIRRKLKGAGRQVDRVLRMIDLNEYKRRQAAPGIKITPLAFGKDRRMPITNHYRER